MSIKRRTPFLILFALMLLTPLAVATWQQRGLEKLKEPTTPVRQVLSEKPPKIRLPEFTGPEEGWPPQPKGVTNIRGVLWKPIPGELTEELEEQIRRAASQDQQVRNVLGDRFAFISTDEIEPDKGRSRSPSEPLPTRVSFFSHTNNVAVEVRMQGLKVESVVRKPGYEPPEGEDEIQLAVTLARKDVRIRDEVQSQKLSGNAILTLPRPGQPGAGHRVLYVTFSKSDEDHPLYFSTVDLTDQKVLDAGPSQKLAKRR